MRIKFSGSIGTRSHKYSVMGYGENTHAKTLILPQAANYNFSQQILQIFNRDT